MTNMLFIQQVPDYLYMKYSVRRTRRAVSYWIRVGLMGRNRRVYLRTERTKDNQLFTRKPWVDYFIFQVSRRKRA